MSIFRFLPVGVLLLAVSLAGPVTAQPTDPSLNVQQDELVSEPASDPVSTGEVAISEEQPPAQGDLPVEPGQNDGVEVSDLVSNESLAKAPEQYEVELGFEGKLVGSTVAGGAGGFIVGGLSGLVVEGVKQGFASNWAKLALTESASLVPGFAISGAALGSTTGALTVMYYALWPSTAVAADNPIDLARHPEKYYLTEEQVRKNLGDEFVDNARASER